MTRPWTAIYEAARTSRKLARLPDDTCRLFFYQLILVLDSYGCIEADAMGIDAKVWPALKKPESETIRAVEALVGASLLEPHGNAERFWFWMPDWEEKAGSHLRRRGKAEFETTSANRRKLSELPDWSRTSPGVVQLPLGLLPQKEREIGERERDSKRDSASAKPPPKRGKSKDATNPNHAPFVEWWCAEFEKATGQPYGFNGGRDGKAVLSILAQAGESLEKAQAYARTLLLRPPGWLAGGGVDLSTLDRHWNVIGTAGQNKQTATHTADTFGAFQ